MNTKTFEILCQKIDAQLFELLSHMMCSICQEIFHQPVKTLCGHSFCNKCINNILLLQNNLDCPLCKSVIKKYSLEDDKAKDTICKICKELPNAFQNDIIDGCKFFKCSKNSLLNASDTIQILFEENPKKIIIKKKKTLLDSNKKTVLNSSDLESRETKNSEVKKSVKNKRNNISKRNKKDDLNGFMSNSLAGSVGNCSNYSTSAYQNKVKNFKEICTNGKIQEQLNTKINSIYSENLIPLPIYISQAKSGENFSAKIIMNIDDKLKKDIKAESCKSTDKGNSNPAIFTADLKKKKKKFLDPFKYEPVQSIDAVQNIINYKRKKELKSQKAESLIKKSIKMRKLILKQKKKKKHNVFDLELSTKEKSKKKMVNLKKFQMSSEKTTINGSRHLKTKIIPWSISNESCSQILKTKSHYKIKENKLLIKKRPYACNLKQNEKRDLRNKGDTYTSFFNPLSGKFFEDNIFKKKHELEKEKKDIKNEISMDQKESYLNLINLKNEEALQLEQGVENYLMSLKKNIKEKNMALLDILEEIVKDDSIYCEKNVSIKFSKNMLVESSHKKITEEIDKLNNKDFTITQPYFNENSTNYFHFLSDKDFLHLNVKNGQFSHVSDLPDFSVNEEKNINNMEMEFNSFLNINSNQDFKKNVKSVENIHNDSQCNKKLEFVASSKNSCEFSNFNEISKVNEKKKKKKDSFLLSSFQNTIKEDNNSFINFLLLGRLTPTTRRSKSSVVKLVFPVGFTSFIKKHNFDKGKQTSFQSLKNCGSSFSNINVGLKTKDYSQFVSRIPSEIQMFNKASSTVFQRLQLKNVFCAKNLDITQLKNINKTGNQLSNDFSSMENKSVSFEKSQVQLFEDDKIQENYLECKSEERNLNKKKKKKKNFKNKTNKQNKGPLKNLSSFLILENDLTNTNQKLIEKNKTQQKKQNSTYNFTNFPITYNQPSQFSDGLVLNKETNTIDFICEKIKSDEFTSTCVQENYKNFMKTKNKKIKKLSDKFETLPAQSEKNFNFELKNLNTDSPEKTRCIQNDSQCVSEENDSDLTFKNKKIKLSENNKTVNLVTEKSQKKEKHCTSQEKILQVLQNIDVDQMIFLPDKKNKKEENFFENIEESDSDFFVEETPPNLMYSRFEERNFLNKNENKKNLFYQKPKKKKLEISQIVHNINGENLSDKFSVQNETDTKNISIVNYVKGGDKILTLNENINYENFESKAYKNNEELNSGNLKPTNFLNCKSNENQNKINFHIQCQNDKVAEDLSEKLTENKLCKINQNFFIKNQFYIVASSVKNLETVKKFAAKFNFEFLDKPKKNMTHLIVGLHKNEDDEMLPLCTPKLLFALANKKWVVSELWAETCLKMNKIVSEEIFETHDPVGGLGCRMARLSQNFLLKNFEIHLLGNFETMSKDELADLITDCGGTLILQPEQFSYSSLKIRLIIVDKDCSSTDEQYFRGLYEKHGSVVLSRDFIIMSIQTYTLSNFLPFLMHASSTEDLVKMGYPFYLVYPEENI